VRPADSWIDPSQPKPRAWVTHGHATTRAAGMARCLRRRRRWRSWKPRCGPQPGQSIAYDETVRVGEVDVRFVPAGHVLGSAQIGDGA